eukprot:CAMPEP_0173266280 /NCGR_PEP_ID=MMETSP1142-20121109/29074_1 /TAXON_ID=483371 /ORGANISM="non described non described, Strain CCMP2298" /LENGTH=361 /DNA_ID=CAMNT_0014202175 /DNA_START=9 /DNA_END=1096 /DNA_ORIENTATION=-
MFDLNVKAKFAKAKDSADMVKAMSLFGWNSIAWDTAAFGKKIASANQKQPSNQRADASDGLGSSAQGNSKSSDGRSEVQQLRRITIAVDDIVDAQSLTAGNTHLMGYDIVAATPGNAAVFAYLCKTAQIDIISIDFSRRLQFPFIKKLVDQAVGRGVHFEIVVSPLLSGDFLALQCFEKSLMKLALLDLSAPQSRKDMLSGTRILVQFLRGRNIILSSGADCILQLRGPHDIINIGQMLNLSREQAERAISSNCEQLLMHAKARRLRQIPVEILSVQDVQERWLSDHSISADLGDEDSETRLERVEDSDIPSKRRKTDGIEGISGSPAEAVVSEVREPAALGTASTPETEARIGNEDFLSF